MPSTEKLHFKITLGGTYWSKRPAYSILVNDQVFSAGEIATASGEFGTVEFDADVAEGDCSLKIRLENKDDSDILKDNYDDPDNFQIIGDLLLNIKSVEIDEIDLGNLVYTKTQFVGDDPARPVLTKCQDLGWNGTWILKFNSPFYIWLLENI